MAENAVHFNIDALPAIKALTAAANALDEFARVKKMIQLYEDLRRSSQDLMKLHDFRQEPDTDMHPSNAEWFEALMRMESCLNAIEDFERSASPGASFPSGVVSFDVGTEPSVTIEVFRDESGNIIDTHEKYKAWQKCHGIKETHPRYLKPGEQVINDHNKTRKQIELEYKCNATCEDNDCGCGRLEALKRARLV